MQPLDRFQTLALSLCLALVLWGFIKQSKKPLAIFYSMADSLRRFNKWIIEWTGIPSKWVLGLEIGLLLTAGGLMLELELYAVAVAFWVLLGFFVIAKAFDWHGIPGQPFISGLCRTGWVGAAIFGCVFLITATNLKRDGRPWFPKKCEISINVSSSIMASVHSRAKWLNHGRTTEVYKPFFQDLFHEWVITVTPNRDAAQTVISIKDARKPVDKIRVVPPQNVIISEPNPGWVSGFEEPTQAPDFYVRTVTFSTLSEPATITIRKPIKSHFGENRISTVDLDLDRQVLASADKCGTKVNPISRTSWPLSDANPHFPELMQQLKALLVQHVTAGPAPTRPDPDEPYPPLGVEESDMTTELHCKNVQCTEMIVTMAEKTRVQ
jgi:hypothetical protein